eukprot:m.36180 g.36180  ORF g.36180 m.36180 type:complete len:71 (+) comp9040_c0_seq1:173-385(+)
MLQVRIRPLVIKQETIGAQRKNIKIDPFIDNDAIEWYTPGDEKGAIILTGVLIKVDPRVLIHGNSGNSCV